MTKRYAKNGFVLCVLTGLVVGVCGCTNPPVNCTERSLTVEQSDRLRQNAFVTTKKQNPGENCTCHFIISVANGSDAALMTGQLRTARTTNIAVAERDDGHLCIQH